MTAREETLGSRPVAVLTRIVEGLVVLGAVSAAVVLGLEFGPLVGVPALVGLPCLVISTRGRELDANPKAYLTTGLPDELAAELTELALLREELESGLEASWRPRIDFDLLRRIGFWLDRQARLSPEIRDWLVRRGAHPSSIRAALHRAVAHADNRRARAVGRKLAQAMAAYAQLAAEPEGRVDPYR